MIFWEEDTVSPMGQERFRVHWMGRSVAPALVSAQANATPGGSRAEISAERSATFLALHVNQQVVFENVQEALAGEDCFAESCLAS